MLLPLLWLVLLVPTLLLTPRCTLVESHLAPSSQTETRPATLMVSYIKTGCVVHDIIDKSTSKYCTINQLNNKSAQLTFRCWQLQIQPQVPRLAMRIDWRPKASTKALRPSQNDISQHLTFSIHYAPIRQSPVHLKPPFHTLTPLPR
jgi:hypothetical protein